MQRVSRAAVDVVGGDAHGGGVERVGEIGAGLCVLVGVTHDDDPPTADRLAVKIWNLRVLDDESGVMNRSLSDRHAEGSPAEVLVVSQFTLYGDTSGVAARAGSLPPDPSTPSPSSTAWSSG